MDTLTFYHSGGIGDIIYSLQTVTALVDRWRRAKISFLRPHVVFVTGLKREAHTALAPLLLNQHFIDEVQHVSETDLPKGYYNLDYFRQTDRGNKAHLANLHLNYFGFSDSNWRAWLSPVDGPNPVYLNQKFGVDRKEKYAVLNVTPRYRDKVFNWNGELRFLLNNVEKIFFLGLIEEFMAFRSQYKIVRNPRFCYWSTSDYLVAARIIVGAKLFSGNQSSMLALRQGFGLPYRMEQSPNHVDSNQYSCNETVINPYTRRIHKGIMAVRQIISDKPKQ